MGYQESFVQVSSFAEAAGIRRAIREHEGHEWFDYVCCERARRAVSFGSPTWWGCAAPWEMPAGTLLVVVSGGRHPYQLCGGRWAPIDGVVGLTRANYYEHFQHLDEGLVDAGWGENSAEAQRAYDVWNRYLDAAWDESSWYEDFWLEVRDGPQKLAASA